MAINFEHAIPESVGVRSEDILSVLETIEKHKLMLHSILIIKNGKLICEGYAEPFTRDTMHRMYSVSKTFVSSAIGLLASQGKLSLEDKILKFFPEYAQKDVHPYLADTSIRDLLMMSTPFSHTTYNFPSPTWLNSFFETTPNHPSGTLFNYDTSGTYILCVIIERLTGKTFLKYLQENVLDEIGFTKEAWCVEAPDGYAWGGSGVVCKALDLAKLAYLYLKGGNHQGKQLLPKEYVKEATKKQIDNSTSLHYEDFRTNGYGYQIWIGPENTFEFYGMGGQCAICHPDKDLLLVCTADIQGNGTFDTIIHDCFFRIANSDANSNQSKPDISALLDKKLHNLKLPMMCGRATSPIQEMINGKKIKIDTDISSLKLGYIKIHIQNEVGTFEYEKDGQIKQFSFGMGKYIEDVFPETGYSGKRINTPAKRGYKCLSAATWCQENALAIQTLITDDYFGNLTTIISWKGNQVGIRMTKNAECFLIDYNGLASGTMVE